MFRKYDINLIYKLIGLLLFILMIFFIENVYVLTIFVLTVIFLNKKNNPLIFFFLLVTVLFLILEFIDGHMYLVNIFLIIDYILIFFNNVNKEEFLLVKKIVFNKKLTYKDLSNIYKDDLLKENEDQFDKFLNKRNINDLENIEDIKERLKYKTNDDVFNKLVINYTRFYKNQNDTYKGFGLNKETIVYLGIHIILLVIAVVI